METSLARKDESAGFHYRRYYTRPASHPYDLITWEKRDASITDHKGGVIFDQKSVEVPSFWSQTATNIVASKYFRGKLGTPEREYSARQLIDRVARTISNWGRQGGYFTDPEEASTFEAELTHILIHQLAAFNSPVWFNVGVEEKPQCSACQPYDAMVTTPYGMIRIGDIVTQNMLGLPVYDSGGITLVTAAKPNGVKTVYRITLSNGVSVDVTADHVVLASSRRSIVGVWQRVDQLQPGMMLQLHPHKSILAASPSLIGNLHGPVVVEEAALAGWLQSDGFVAQYADGTDGSLTLEFETANDEEYDFVVGRVGKVFQNARYNVTSVKVNRPDLKYRRVRMNGETLRPFVTRYNLLDRGMRMRAPKGLFTAGKDAIVEYLRSIFQAEGYVAFSGKDRSSSVAFAVVSRDFARDIQRLLLCLGIYSRLRMRKEKARDKYDLWEVDISIGAERKKFSDRIGFISARKQGLLRSTLKSSRKKCPDILWEKIVAIEELGEKPVYDIQTLSGHYLSENVVVHNCFINSVKDDMRSIMQLAMTEGMLFKYGSGCTGARSFVWTTFCGLEQMENLWQRLGKDFPQVPDTEGYSCYIEPLSPIYTMALRADGTFVRDRIEKMWKFNLKPHDKLRLVTSKGAEALVSAWHPCMILDEGKIMERRADQLSPGDLLIGPNHTMEQSWPFTEYQRVRYSFEQFRRIVEEETPLDETLAWLVGYFVGDGGIGDGKYSRLRTGTRRLRVRFWDETRENLERVQRILKERFGVKASIRRNMRGSAAFEIKVNKARACGFFQLIAPPGRKSSTISLPDWAFKSPLSVVHALVAGILDSEGTASADRGGVRATVTTASPRLAEQLRALVAYLGWITTNTRTSSNDSPWLHVTILSGDTKETVKQAIAAHMSHPDLRHRLESAQDPSDRLWRRDGLPWNALGLDEIMSDTGLDQFRRSYRSNLKFEVVGRKFYLAPARSHDRIGKGRLLSFLNAALPYLSPVARSRAEMIIRVMDGLDEVREVRSASEDSLPFYDFELTSQHTYLAGERGMITIHNTGSNLSTLRSSREHLSTGGKASGPVSFMKGFDAFAGVIKSGGRTRRAAKMVILNVDHPDICDFIWSKANEEKKAWALLDAGYDGSVDGEAYSSIFFQNANHSVRVTDEFMHAVVGDKEWQTRFVTSGKVADTYRAKDLFHQMAEAAYVCGDPGIQFDTTINEWHPCPETARINASNPCSEYMFLDDSACNLASLNLMKFRTSDGSFDVEAFKHAVEIIITAQEILVDFASYPTPAIGKNSHDYRPLGLGYANLGALLMAQGVAYDSEEGRNIAAAISALMSGHAYAVSSQIARKLGTFAGYRINEKHFLNVIGMHRAHAYKIGQAGVQKSLQEAAKRSWDEALQFGEEHGFKNAQISVIAPTGTIAFMMDCDTTGIEPDIALVKYKWLVGGGVIKIVNNTVREALVRLGYSKDQTDEIISYLEENDTIEGAPGLRPEHLPVFDCAFKPSKGSRSIHFMGHVKMMSAVQPFISGAISKTVNMPNNVTVEEIVDTYVAAWRMGLKAIAIYRDGSKRTQPLTTTRTRVEKEENEESREKVVYKPLRRRLSSERQAIIHKFTVASNEGYLVAGLYEDGTPGEIFVVMAKEGSTISGLMDAFSTSISLALQYGVPLKVLVNKFIHTRFEPSGMTNNPEIRFAKSIVDYIFRWLGLRFLSKEDQAAIGLTGNISENNGNGAAGGQNVISQEKPAHATTPLTSRMDPVKMSKNEGDLITFDPQSDAPSCDNCGMIMVRNGSCYKCLNCGSTSGCG